MSSCLFLLFFRMRKEESGTRETGGTGKGESKGVGLQKILSMAQPLFKLSS